MSDLPLEMLESLLMPAFLSLHASDFEGDDDHRPHKFGKSRSAERRAFILLSSVCWYWYQTLIGWPQSATRLWLKHRVKKLIERQYS